MNAPPDLFPFREETRNCCSSGHAMIRWSHLDGDECPLCAAMRQAARRDLASDLDALPVEVIVRVTGGRLADEIRRR